MLLRRNPLVVVALALSAGVVFRDALHPPIVVLYAGAGLLVPTLVVSGFWQKSPPTVEIIIQQLIILFLVPAGGLLREWQERLPANHVDHLQGRYLALEGVVANQPKATKFGFYVWTEARVAADNDDSATVAGKLQLYYPKSFRKISPGDVLNFRGRIEPFDLEDADEDLRGYFEYLAGKGIRSFVRAKHLEKTGTSGELEYWLLRFRESLSNRIRTQISDTAAANVATAILLGDKSRLPDELRAAYAASGLAHLLALSGAHVAVLLLLFYGFFAPLKGLRGGRLIRAALLTAFLLVYMTMTGLSPSVVRASLMGALILWALALRRRNAVLNALAFSAITMMAFRAGMIYEIGFQLSYAAVLAIVLWAPLAGAVKLPEWRPRIRKKAYKLEKSAQKMTASAANYLASGVKDAVWVSLATQLFTLPLILFYFGAFPAYFLPANVAAFLLAFLAIAAGFVYLLLIWTGPLAAWLARIAGGLIALLNDATSWFSKLPGANIEDVYLSKSEAAVLWIAILLFTLAVRRAMQSIKKRRAFR